MSLEKLKNLRERTVLVKAANVIEKQGGVDRIIATLLKSTKTSGNALANSTVAKTKSEKGDKKKSDNFLKSAMYAGSGARPGPSITSMGTGLAPFAIQAQPKVAQNSVEIAGRGLETAYPGLTAANKSTAAMKRNAGSVMASANRQKPKKAKGELVAPTATLTAPPVIQQGKTAYASADLAQLEKQAMNKLALIGFFRGAANAYKAWRAARGANAVARGATALRKGTEGMRSLSQPVYSGGRYDPGAYATRGQELFNKYVGQRFRRGIGMGRNIYEQGGQRFIGPRSWMNYIPGGARFQTMAMNARAAKAGLDPVKLVRTGTATGGIVTRTGKSLIRGAGAGGTLGYGASFVPGIGDPSTKDVGWADPQRLRMAAGGAMMGAPILGGGGLTAGLAATGLTSMTPYGMTEGMETFGRGMANIQGAKELRGGGRYSKMDAVIKSRARQSTARSRDLQQQRKKLDAAAMRNR